MPDDRTPRPTVMPLGGTRYTFLDRHDDLLVRVRPPAVTSTAPPCDVLVVPTHRHPQRLRPAARLAHRLRCSLLVLCSPPGERTVLDVIGPAPDVPVFVLSLPWPAAGPLTGRAAPPVPCRSLRHVDVAAKRNLALALARLLAWRRVLFLDDDIRDLDPHQVRGAGSLLDGGAGLRAAGWTSEGFPDNSVLCHARRWAGKDQGVFVGGSTLLLDATGDLPWFPGVYNEDWLFLFDLLRSRAVGHVGATRQLTIDPFVDPRRAVEEEFGDLLGEGLFHLLHADLALRAATTEDYWQDVVAGRRAVMVELLAATARPGTGDPRRAPAEAVRRCLDAALARHSPDLPGHLARFVADWRADRDAWRDRLSALRPCRDPGAGPAGPADVIRALTVLGLPADRLHLRSA